MNNNNPTSTKNFCDRYRARVETSPYRVNRVKNTHITFTNSEAIVDPALDIEYQQMVAIHMPEEKFHALVEHDEWVRQAGLPNNNHFHNNVMRVSNLVVEHERECQIRHENPAVKDAYEKYLTLLHLAQ